MDELVVPAHVDSVLSWDYRARSERIADLYQRAKKAQWNAATDVDWTVPVAFGEPLPDGSAHSMAAFNASPLARHGRPMWDTFRWEFQSWTVSQFLHGEQGALVATARLAEVLPDVGAKSFAAVQVGDEARHVEAFSRYVAQCLPHPYPVSGPLAELLRDVLSDPRWDVVALGMQIVVEGLALASLRLTDASFHDPLIKQISTLVARDEARHVSFGVLALAGTYAEMTAAERAEREQFVLDAAELMRQRFLLGEVWDRLGVDSAAGREFTTSSELMIQYRRAVFGKVVSAIVRIGLMSPRLRDELDRMGLLGYAGRGAVAAVRAATTAAWWR
jgi:P-aminobenzoate N-oxygenase AurF